jgi:hypothetical protein
VRKFFDKIYDFFNEPEMSIQADYIEIKNGFYVVNITLTGPEYLVLTKITPQVRKEIKGYDLSSNLSIDVPSDFEGLMEYKRLKKGYVKVLVSCRPGNMGKFIEDKEFVRMIRDAASKF